VRRPAENHDAGEVFTVGHSTHPLERFLELLSAHGIAALADVRSFPHSRRWPQFNQEQLRESVERHGIQYHWLRKLGGRRRGLGAKSPHLAWQHPAFRSYADYADTAEFQQWVEELIALARRARTAYMCSEGLWWRCHRRLISDRLLLLGWRVRHILPDGKFSDHALPQFARVIDGRLIYDKPDDAASYK
jgi:uncharacterized protein (DUF488 family)